MTIGLIGCCKKKLPYKSQAKDLYISPLFKKSLIYSESQHDKTFILSAKYGLLELNTLINPYDMTLNNMDLINRKKWGENISSSLNKILKKEDIIYIYAGKNYYEFIKIENLIYLPFNSLLIGKRLKLLKELLSCKKIHKLV